MGPAVGDDLRAGHLTGVALLDPADLGTLEGLFAKHRFRPSHRLGQNFLVDPQLRDRVAEEAGVGPGDSVLEVGAGPGSLTVALAERAEKVIALEIDRRLIGVLREVTAGDPRVEVLEGDMLKLPLPSVPLVAGNIPYYLTGALLPRLLERPDPPRAVSLVVQKEVAERWVQAGDWSLATLAVQVFAVPELRFTLPREAFWPVPGVDSALVTLAVRERPAVEVPDMAAFFAFAERIFQFRRKQLGGTLARLAGPEAGERLGALGIDPQRRPQTLSLAEWETLFRAFEEPG
ncbi:MAG TPA: 16S rRNA (adenine(1518)-N(6)/adenine(1519)-N(6))-dimethyltransferase RsmA [Candidatus Dormibacteraeota bacterium]